MTPKRRRPARDKYAEDPLVPLDPESLRAAVVLREELPAVLADRLGLKKQLLAHHLDAVKPTRCRRSLRRVLAKALRVSEDTLAGSAPSSLADSMALGYEYLYSRRTQFAAAELIARCLRACERDAPSPAGDEGGAVSPVDPLAVRSAVLRLLCVGRWRQRVLVGFPPTGSVLEPREADLWAPRPERRYAPEHEAAVLALIRAWEHILEPWLEGTTSIDGGALGLLAGPDWEGPAQIQMTPEDERETEQLFTSLAAHRPQQASSESVGTDSGRTTREPRSLEALARQQADKANRKVLKRRKHHGQP